MKTKNVKNNTVGALIFFTLFCLAPGMVGAAVQSSTAHSSVVLKDYQGKNVESSKLPVSYIASCGSCHDIDYINQGYHFQMGREATLSAGAYKTFRMKYADGGNAFLPPAEQENLSLPWFLHRPIYSSGGMYGRVAMNHTQKLAPVTTDDPLKLTFTTPDQATDICSNCHAGGGYHLEDREGNKLAARAVGESGHVIGVDMTPEMLAKARGNAAKAGHTNVEFRLGEIEHLPVADNSVDVIISNCVINLSPEKQKVFDESFRVLKPGGRLAVSDVVAAAELPEEVKNDLALHAGCIAGASLISDVEEMLRKAGFDRIRIDTREESREFIREWAPGRHIEDFVVSATIEALKT